MCSTFIFLTTGFQIVLGIQLGAFFGAEALTLSPLNICTEYVPSLLRRPRSLKCMLVNPLVAAFNAACLGELPVNTCSVSLLPSLST